jgi:hypothetical protein
MGRVVHEASCPWGELSWGELSMGLVVPGASCPWGELSMGRVVVWRVLMGRVVRGTSFDGASDPGTTYSDCSEDSLHPISQIGVRIQSIQLVRLL